MKKKKWPKVLTIVLLCVVALGVVVALNIPKPAKIPQLDLSTLSDGQYDGQFDNGLIAAEVAVVISDHRIETIDLLSHRYGMGQKAEAIVDDVISAQSLDVDAISGATLSSNTILKAIANALEEAK